MPMDSQFNTHTMNALNQFSAHCLDLNVEAATEQIVASLRQSVHAKLRGQVVASGISGGINASTVQTLCGRSLGPAGVTGVLLPERDSSTESATLAHKLASQFGIDTVTEDITDALEGLGCYRRLAEAMSHVFPDYGPGWKAKITLPGSLLEKETLNIFSLSVTNPQGQTFTRRLPLGEYYQIVAASNFKQRTRMAMLYYHAERRNYAVIGTANKNEHDQGFFVKYGDGGVDTLAIAHLYKTQVYQFAEYLGVPREICQRPPTTDTYSAPGSQQEFFFRLPFETMDLLWFAQENGVPIGEVARVMGLTERQVQRAFNDFAQKHRTTRYLRMAPLGIEPAQT